MMRAMSCVGGETQIERVLSHAIRETGKNRGGAVVFVGDAMEEKVDRLGRLAGELGPLRPSSSTKAATRPPRQHSSKLPPSQGCLLRRSIAPAQLGSRNCSGHFAVFAVGGHWALKALAAKRVARSCASATS